jgi:hypothetical protein
VARVKSTARLMTTKELVAAGLPAEPEVRELRTAQPAEDETSLAASGSSNREDGRLDQRKGISKISTLI